MTQDFAATDEEFRAAAGYGLHGQQFYGTWASYLVYLSLNFHFYKRSIFQPCFKNQSYCMKAFTTSPGIIIMIITTLMTANVY